MINEVNIKTVLVELFSGYSFRTKVENDPKGIIAVVQMKDLGNDYTSINSNLIKVTPSSIPQKYLLKVGDVLFISKGANNYAVIFDKEFDAVAASAFFILRPDQKKVLPEYLTWYLNQKSVQQYIKDNRAGTYIPNVNKSTIEGIQINLPSMERQRNIANAARLLNTEQLLLKQIAKKRNELINAILLSNI